MTQLIVGRSLKDSDVLWRYMSPEKFVDLLHAKELYFSPLSSYVETDPFEGYMPAAGVKAMADVSNRFREQHLNSIAQFEANLSPLPAEQAEELKAVIRKLREDAESHTPTMRDLAKNIAATTMVNCWVKSEHESEGMWRLYAKNGVAIRTSVGALRHLLNDKEDKPVIHIGSVKYLNYSDPNLTAQDCVSEDGHLLCMTKRIAYEHEKEVRMFIARTRPAKSLELLIPEYTRVAVEVERMIESIVISPFATALAARSLRAVVKWAGLNEAVLRRSNLLDTCEYLWDAYK